MAYTPAPSITVTPVLPAPLTLEHDGKTYEVTLDRLGEFRVSYRSSPVRASTLTRLREALVRADSEAAEKRDRAKRLAAARANPVPAMDLAGRLIGVRGIDQRSGKILIVEADGTKNQTYRQNVLRVLTDEEKDALDEARQAYAARRAGQDVLKALGVDKYDIARRDLTLSASYDSTADGWVTEYDGVSFGPGSLRDLRDAVIQHIADRDYPWRLTRDGLVHHYTRPGGGDVFFAEKYHASAYHQAQVAARDAHAALLKVQTDLAFDFSTLTAPDEEDKA